MKKTILPPPPLLKLQKAFRGLIDGGIEVEEGKVRENVWALLREQLKLS